MVLVVALAAGLGFWLAHRLDHSVPALTSGTWLPQPRSPGEFSLIDQNNAPFTAARLKGAPTLVYFGYTHCPDVCPLTLLSHGGWNHGVYTRQPVGLIQCPHFLRVESQRGPVWIQLAV